VQEFAQRSASFAPCVARAPDEQETIIDTEPTGRRGGVAALASSAMLASFLQTIMTPLVPELPRTFHTDASSVSWVLTAALLAGCVTAPVSGRLGDLFGRKRILLALLGVIVVGSVIGGLSTGLGGVITARVFQGIGLGVMALNVSAIREVVAPARLPAAVATVSASNGIGGALGLPLSATISEYTDYHGLFWLAAALAVISGVLIWIAVPNSVPTSRTTFDPLGAVGLAVGLGGVVLAISEGPEWGWTAPGTIVAAAGGLAALALWGRHELRISAPLVDLRMMAARPVLITNLIGITSGFTWFAVPGVVTRLLQSVDGSGPGMGLDMVHASIVVVPTGLSMLFFAPVAQRLVRRYGARMTIRTGSAIAATAYIVAALTMHRPWELAIVACLVGIGSVLTFSSASILIMANVPANVTAAANGLNAVARWLGSTLSSAILGAVLASLAVTWAGAPVPATSGYHVAFVLAAVMGVAGFCLGGLLPRPIVDLAARAVTE
jgi:MFS family permease